MKAEQVKDKEFLNQLTFEPLSKKQLGKICSTFWQQRCMW